MIDRKQYDINMDKVRLEQIKSISDFLSDYIKLNAKMRELPVNLTLDDVTIEKIKNTPIPKKGRDAKEVGDEIVNDILSHTMNIQHPRFFSFVTSAVSPYSLAGSILCDIYNPNVCGWSVAPAPAMIEEKCIEFLASRIGFDTEKSGGLFTSGGSLSNLTGFIAARENKLPGRFDLPLGVAFISDQTHSSSTKGLRMMGLRDDQIVKIPTDDDFRMRVDLLEEAIKKEIENKRKPFIIVGTIGTTNTGSIDPLDELADLAEKYGMWLHVDGAYGGSVLFSDIYNNLAKGVERADSVAWDLHKWSLQVYSCSAIIAKDKNTFINAFAEHPEYLADAMDAEHNDGWDLGIEMSRPARCIKFWYTLQAMGTDLLADVIDYSFYNAKIAQRELEQLDGWKIISKPMCGAINFRYEPNGYPADRLNELNMQISKKMLEDGYVHIVTTELRGKKVLRLCLINCNTTTDDVKNTIEYVNRIANEIYPAK